MTEETSLDGASASSGKGSQAWEQGAVSGFCTKSGEMSVFPVCVHRCLLSKAQS